MCVCIGNYVCKYACMCMEELYFSAHTQIDRQFPLQIDIYARSMYVCIYVGMCVCLWKYLCVQICMEEFMYVCKCVCMYMCKYICIHV